jgi:drug/metabolite transporter (DMT)-like permease
MTVLFYKLIWLPGEKGLLKSAYLAMKKIVEITNIQMNNSIDFKLILALVGVALFWGTTYLGIRVAVESIPAWYVASCRHIVGTVVIFIILVIKKELKWIGWGSFRRQILFSLLMVVVANGMTTVAEETIPSGLASLLHATSPLFVFLGSAFLGMQKPTLRGLVGVLFGFIGILLIFKDGISDLMDPGYEAGIISLIIAVLSWTTGTIYTKRYSDRPQYIFLNLFYQFLFAAIIQFCLALIFSGKPNFQYWKLESIAATVYLALFGSVLGFFCYHYALKKVSALSVSILTYFNTIIAIFLGWLILDEHVDINIIIATGLIITGVFITNFKSWKVAPLPSETK